MPMQWTPEAMGRLYLAILKSSDGLTYNAQEIAKYMGPDCTPKAVTHRLAIVKNEVKNLAEAWDGLSAASTTEASAATPRKRSRTTCDGNNKDKNGEDNGNDDHDGGAGNKAKMKKSPASAKKPRAKAVTPPVKEGNCEMNTTEVFKSIEEEH